MGSNDVSIAVNRILGSVVQSLNMRSKMGMMFNGARDFYQQLGYKRDVEYSDNFEKFKRQGIVSRIISAYPNAVWSRPPSFAGNIALEDAINGEYNGALENGEDEVIDGIAQKLNLYNKFNRAEQLAGLGKFSVLLLGFDDISNSLDMKNPVKEGSSSELLYIQVYGYNSVKILSYEDDMSNENFGKPKTYQITLNNNKIGSNINSKILEVNYTRIVHVVDSVLDDEFEGIPVIEKVYNELDDLIKIVGGSAEAAWQAFYKGMQFDVDKDMKFTSDDAKKMSEEIEKYSHGVQRHIKTRGMKINELGADHINPGPVFNVCISMISITTAIPQRIFIGSEQGKLASEQDRTNWASQVAQKRIFSSEPRLLRVFITKCQFAGCLPSGAYLVDWPDAYYMSPSERAVTAERQAKSFMHVTKAMNEKPDVLSLSEGRSIIFARDELSARVIDEEKKLTIVPETTDNLEDNNSVEQVS